MRTLLAFTAAAIAAAAILPGTAAAESLDGAFVGIPSPSVQSGSASGFRHDRRRNRGFDGAILYYDREYQGDTAWRSESFNDWWHDQPNRSYPAWMQRNRDCKRLWWEGDQLRC